MMVHFVLEATPFHSFLYIPHILAVSMMVDMCRIQELAPFLTPGDRQWSDVHKAW
jgi:hypothetical protein